jgi:hypothetical protein
LNWKEIEKKEKKFLIRIFYPNIRSQAVQRNLIRPLEVNLEYQPLSLQRIEKQYPKTEEEPENIHLWRMSENYIREEMINLQEYDNINYPLKGTKV